MVVRNCHLFTQISDKHLKNNQMSKLNQLIEDIEFLRDRADEPLVKIAYNMAITVIKTYLAKSLQEDDAFITREKVICAAIWYKDLPNTEATYRVKNITNGVVLCGWRHPYIIGQSGALLGKKQYEMGEYVQGFLTSKGRFLDREQSAKLFVENGGKLQYSSNELFSEDLY